MAEVKNDEEELALPSKRKSDICPSDTDDDLKKKQKLEASSDHKSSADEAVDKKIEEEDADADALDDVEHDFGSEDDDDDNEDDDDDDDEDEDGDEKSNGNHEIDRKGKGLMREDKGKGKLVEESDDDDSSDDDESGDHSGDEDDSDLSDDPLAEVDLDNILPSRTRRRSSVLPGVHISNDAGANNNGRGDA